MILQGKPFKNSDACQGMVFATDGAKLDMAVIEIDGRYPESGWARNRECDEMVRVIHGTGELVFKSASTTHITEGDVVYIPSGTWFAWSGDMTILMACSPVFDSGQYEVKE